MLLVDVELALLPVVADLRERRQDHLPQDGFDAERGEALVEHGLQAGLVVVAGRGEQAGCGVLKRDACALGSGEAGVERPPHARDPLGVLRRVEPEAARGAVGLSSP